MTVTDLGGYEANQFATELGQKWGVGGQAKFDNGVVILVSTGGGEGNRDAYIAVGYGLEGAIPDITAGHITDEFLIPSLKAGDYYRAFDQTSTALMEAAAGEYKAPEGYRRGGKSGISIAKIILIIIILIFVFGASGGVGKRGGYMSRPGYRGFGGPVIFPGGFGGGGFGGGFGGGGGGGFGGFGGGGFGRSGFFCSGTGSMLTTVTTFPSSVATAGVAFSPLKKNRKRTAGQTPRKTALISCLR